MIKHFKNKLNESLYHILAFLVVVVWGTTFISTKVLLINGLSPESIFFYRFLLAYFGIWLFAGKRLFAHNLKDEFFFLLLGISGGSFYFLVENYALKITLASNVSLIVCTAPILTAVLTHWILKTEKLTRQLLQGSFIALLGVAFVVYNGSFILELNPLGDFLSFLAALFWAFYTIIFKSVSDRYSTLFITRKIFFYGLLTILPAFIINPLATDGEVLLQPVVWGNLLFLGAVASLTCYFLWNVTVKKLGTVRTTNYIYFIPIVTLIASFVALPDEKITFIALIGAALILIGVVLSGQKRK
jgi:drug/metabolite transporter (DMT)-like permease